MTRKTSLIIGAITVILIGFLRDYLFYNINWIYLTLVNGRMNAARDEFHFLLEWTPHQINILKFVLTGVFILLFFLTTFITLRNAFKNKKNNRIIIATFLIPGLIALLLAAVGKLSGFYEELYGAIHALTTFIQSFIPIIVLGLVFSFLPAEKSQ
ncbi:MAG: hypothetical protein ACPG21_11590 [Crocinitomicaceae bacterium]